MSAKAEALRWIVFQRLMEHYNADFLNDEATVKRIEEAVEKAARELEMKDEVVIEINFISANAEGTSGGPVHFKEKVRREDIEPLLDEAPWIEEPDDLTEENQDLTAGGYTAHAEEMQPAPLGPEHSSSGLLFLLAFLAALVFILMHYLNP